MTNAFTANGLLGSYLSDPDVAAQFEAPRFHAYMIAFERAWTVALGEVGAVDSTPVHAALAAIDDFALDVSGIGAGADRDGMPVPALVKALKAAAGDAAPAVHAGATSQDVIDTAMVLALRQVGSILDYRLQTTLDHLAALRAAHGTTEMMGRTRMQAALPITVAARVDAWTLPVAEARTRLAGAANALPVQVGGAVGLRDKPEGSGTRMADIVARELGLPLGPVWHTARAPLADYGHALTLTAGALGKIAQDIALMAQQGVDEIQLKGGGGSSAMPHKQNPVAAEAMMALARYVAGQQGILAQALIHEQERSGAAWALEWLTLPAMAEATGAAARHATETVSRIERMGPPPAWPSSSG